MTSNVVRDCAVVENLHLVNEFLKEAESLENLSVDGIGCRLSRLYRSFATKVAETPELITNRREFEAFLGIQEWIDFYCRLFPTRGTAECGAQIDQTGNNSQLLLPAIIGLGTMTKLIESGRIMVLDTETTGFPPSGSPTVVDNWKMCRLMEVAWTIHDRDGTQMSAYETLVKPTYTFDLRPEVIKVHGISKDKASSDGIDATECLEKLSSDLAGVELIVGHNVTFDIRVMLSEIARANMMDLYHRLFFIKTACTMRMGTELMPNRKKPKLEVLYKHLFPETPSLSSHRAMVDVIATSRIYFVIRERQACIGKRKERKFSSEHVDEPEPKKL